MSWTEVLEARWRAEDPGRARTLVLYVNVEWLYAKRRDKQDGLTGVRVI
jgi:hypothetical protein